MFCKKDSNKVVLIPVTLEPFIKTIIRDKIEFLLYVLISIPLVIAIAISILLSLNAATLGQKDIKAREDLINTQNQIEIIIKQIQANRM